MKINENQLIMYERNPENYHEEIKAVYKEMMANLSAENVDAELLYRVVVLHGKINMDEVQERLRLYYKEHRQFMSELKAMQQYDLHSHLHNHIKIPFYGEA